MIAPNPDRPHDPTVDCAADHCYLHHVDEPVGTTGIVCGECGHGYPDVATLVTVDAQLRQELGLTPLDTEAVARVLDGQEEDVFRIIPTCPVCAHDF